MDASLTLERIVNFLLETPLFRDLDPTELAEVVRIMQVQRVRGGQPVFRESDEGDAWFVLFSGEADVFKESPFGGARHLSTLVPPSCFGEMAILDGSRRSASVLAKGEVTVFRFPRLPFNDLLEEGNLAAYKLVYQMARVLSERQRALTQRLSEAIDGDPNQRPVLHRSIGELLDSYTVSE